MKSVTELPIIGVSHPLQMRDHQPRASSGRHLAVVLLFLGILILLSIRQLPLHYSDHRELKYAVVICAEWFITGFIWLGCCQRGISMREFIGARTSGWKAIVTDFGLAIGFLIAANVFLSIFGHLVPAAPNRSMRNLLPHTGLEGIAFLLLAATAGFCEEVIYRGYLQRQFALRFGSVAAGVVSQSLVFGASHIYQGPRMATTVCFYGCLFGLLALWRKRLRPGMIAHFLQDGVGGMLLARYALR